MNAVQQALVLGQPLPNFPALLATPPLLVYNPKCHLVSIYLSWTRLIFHPVLFFWGYDWIS